MKPPNIRVVDTNAYIAADVRIMGWREMRRIISLSNCAVMETRVGLITKRFHVTGNQEQLTEFIHNAWYSETMGRQFRQEIVEACK